ncbi:hypothetical protein A4H97_13160 [Niastella yeongjuensis]|uniref:Lipocalin-like domain-containing protein n=1 Tax=Niastella yeongjuensis TaxID=354355 RepID=A0A1V9EAC5_9BACT|nr:hypothetical protein [Niastella yeongjuensis]OQP43087.1 hypothetical protein A4H97_13160 [Niastella yeongjuensis]SEO65858.1 hypothetical protein SAMN05660816_03303 [Niastella yeongjuensis]
MKKTYSFLVIALLLTAMVACKKDKDEDNNPNDELVSTWELESTATSWVPQTFYEPGNGNLLIFKVDSYTSIYKNQIVQQGSYTSAPDNTVEDNTCMTNLKDIYTRSITFVYDSPGSPYKRFYYVADNKLYLISGCNANDAHAESVYRRVNPSDMN